MFNFFFVVLSTYIILALELWRIVYRIEFSEKIIEKSVNCIHAKKKKLIKI